MPLPFIQERLGHENITTTVSVYGHLLPDAHTRMADSLRGSMSNVLPVKQISASTDTNQEAQE
jgi:site-specific recombinase XerC